MENAQNLCERNNCIKYGNLLLILDFAIIAQAVADLLANSLVLLGAGKVSKYISSYVWRLPWLITRKNGQASY